MKGGGLLRNRGGKMGKGERKGGMGECIITVIIGRSGVQGVGRQG